MKHLTFSTKALGIALFIWYTSACTSTPTEVIETVVTDSTFNDTGVVNPEDTAILNYPPANETFVDEGSGEDNAKEKIKIEE